MPTTRLAAIMFTDIVGYTAMMQRNQAEAMAAVKGYETVLKAHIQAHGGDLPSGGSKSGLPCQTRETPSFIFFIPLGLKQITSKAKRDKNVDIL